MIRRLLCLLCLATGPAIAQAGEGNQPAKATTAARIPGPGGRLQQTRDNIERLFRHRDANAGTPNSRWNPFRTAGDAVPVVASLAGGAMEAVPAEAESDAKLLRDSIAVLRIAGGTIENSRDGSLSLPINDTPYREGQSVRARLGQSTVTLRIKQITSDSVTFALNNAEQTYRFRGPATGEPDSAAPLPK